MMKLHVVIEKIKLIIPFNNMNNLLGHSLNYEICKRSINSIKPVFVM